MHATNGAADSRNCSHFIGKRKQQRKTPRQKRKQKRKPGIAHVGNVCFHIDFILFLYAFVILLIVSDMVYMA